MVLISHKTIKYYFYSILFITLFSSKYIVSEILPISCEGETLNYSISVNLTKYLNSLTNNKSIIENKTIYEKQEDLKGKKGGVVRGTIYEYISKKKNNPDQFIVYDSYDEALAALNNHSIEYFVCYKEIVGELIQMYTENLTYINIEDEDNKKEYESGFLMKSDKNKIKNELELLFNGSNTNQLYDLLSNWLGVDEGLKYVDKNVENPKDNLTILVNFNQPPAAYKENNEQKGLIIQLLYAYAQKLNYNLDIKETNTVEDFIPAVINNTVDTSVGYFYKEDINNSFYLVKTPVNATTVSIIRYDNAINSTEWGIPNSIEDLDGENLAVLSGQEDLIKELFPESKDKIRTYKSPNELFNLLLKEDVDGILIDKIIVDFYEKNNDRITSYEDILTNNSYGFSFTDKNLSEEFNSFLKDKNYNENKLNELFNEWKEATKDKTIDKEYTVPKANASKLYVSFPNIRPMCYKENGINKGYELDLLYRFAKEKGYELVINSENVNNNVSIGCQNITNKEGIYFSDPILNSSSVLAVRKDSKRDLLPITALYGNYTEKNNNIIEIPVEIPDGNIKIASCILPEKFYNDTILINCSINNITEEEQSYFNGTEIKYGKSNDRIKILYSTLDVNNILNANHLFSDETIIKQSNTSNLICAIFGNNITNNTNTNTNSTNDGSTSNTKNSFNRFIPKKKSNNKASTIIAIVIPCVVALLAIIIVTSLVNRGATSAPIEIKGFRPSETALGIKNELP